MRKSNRNIPIVFTKIESHLNLCNPWAAKNQTRHEFSRPETLEWVEFSSPEILEWVAFSFSRGSSQSRDQACLPRCWWILYQLSHREAQEY